MAPLVLGGAMRPGRAIGARAALALGELGTPPVEPLLERRVHDGRVRRARELVPIDELGPPTGDEWTLAAALHDILQSTNPSLDRALRRTAAARILELAEATIDRVRTPANVHEAVSRHAWFARVLDIARTDTAVSWWTGSHAFLGAEPPRRLLAWPRLRRVSIVRTPRRLMDLAPLAVDPERLVEVVAKLLACTPLTDLATCTRALPTFVWGEGPLALVMTLPGQTLATRALARLPTAEVDAALGRATRDALATRPRTARAAVDLLANRAIARAEGHVTDAGPTSNADPAEGKTNPVPASHGVARSTPADPMSFAAHAAFARALGAAAAVRALASPHPRWNEADRRKLRVALEPAAREAPPLLAALDASAAIRVLLP
jgi:hypothetical protein